MALKYHLYGACAFAWTCCIHKSLFCCFQFSVSVSVSILIIISFSLIRHAHHISFVHRLIMGDSLCARLVRSLLFLFSFHLFFYVSLFFRFISIYDFEIVMWAQRYARASILNLDRWMYALQSYIYIPLNGPFWANLFKSDKFIAPFHGW